MVYIKDQAKASESYEVYLDKKAEKLKKEKEKQKPEYKNNPAFGDASHHSNKKLELRQRDGGMTMEMEKDMRRVR